MRELTALSPLSGGPVSVLLVGLGGGGLAQFLRDFVPSVTIEVVELDPVVFEVAKEWFGFRPDDRLTVTLGDGLDRISVLEKEGRRRRTRARQISPSKKERRRNVYFSFLSTEGNQSFDVIIFDVDNKDSTVGMSGPPATFVETAFLQKVCNLLTPRGTEMLTIFTCHQKSSSFFKLFISLLEIILTQFLCSICAFCPPLLSPLLNQVYSYSTLLVATWP